MKSCFSLLFTLMLLSFVNVAFSQSPINVFYKCIEQLRESDSIKKLSEPIVILIKNDSFKNETIKYNSKSKNVFLLFKNEIFFDKYQNNFNIDSFTTEGDKVIIVLKRNINNPSKLKPSDYVYIRIFYNIKDNTSVIEIKK